MPEEVQAVGILWCGKVGVAVSKNSTHSIGMDEIYAYNGSYSSNREAFVLVFGDVFGCGRFVVVCKLDTRAKRQLSYAVWGKRSNVRGFWTRSRLNP